MKIKVKSVQDALKKKNGEENKYIKKYGEMMWMAALLTAYECGGYEEFKKNYEKVPIKYIGMLLDAYHFKNTELELSIAQGASRPYMEKKDSIEYMSRLKDRLEGKA